MSTSLHYRSNLRDIFFNLFEFLDVGSTTLGHAPFAHMDETTARESLQAFEKLASNELAVSFAEADRVGLKIDAEGNVTLPEALKKSMKAYYDAGWHRLDLPEHIGGFGAPPTVAWSLFAMQAGAHASAAFYFFGTAIARIIDRLGTEAQRQRFVEPMIERAWGAAMVLTEPDAGSDVGAGRTRARQIEGDLWEIEGTKRFITNGDYDFAENIIHLVLARPEGHGPGTKGLSMFIVPKFWVNDDGSLGERNGVYCTNVEKKMGIKASATCDMAFGDRGRPARGFLVGNVHDGIRQMFHAIEWARMAIGFKSMETLSTAYLNALAYTRERVQGADLTRAADKAAPRVRIIEHPDVRRMLMTQKSHAEGMRALCLYTASIQDQVEILGGHGDKRADQLDRRNDLLLPLVKGYNSEKSFEMLALSLQCLGGAGYMQDYPIEQYLRDQKIDSLYEGTTHIQAQDFIFRKVLRDGGKTLQGLLGEIRATVDEGAEDLAMERQALGRALTDVQGIFGIMMGKMGESVYHVGLQGNRILSAVAELVIGWLLVRQSALAHTKAANAIGEDRAFYQGKIASARFFCRNVLPTLTLTRKLIEGGTLELMEISEEAF